MLKAAVIGLGIGEKHATAFQNHKEIILKKVCDLDQKKLNNLNIKFPNLLTVTDDQLILKDADIDIVSIASYDNYHANQITQAIENGKHVMAEKPLCLSLEEMIKIKNSQKQNKKVKISANHVLRSNHRFDKFRNEIDQGQFGEIFYLEADYYWGRKKKLFGWRSEMDYYSIILGAAIHMIDIVMWLLNSKPITVQVIGSDIPSKRTNLKYNSFAIILLKFKNGVIAKITGNGGCVHPHFHGLKIFGSKRTTVHDLPGAYYFDSSENNPEPVPITEPYPDKESREKVLHTFVDSILDDSVVPLVTQQDVYDVMSVCFAAEEAMNTGKTEIIKYLK